MAQGASSPFHIVGKLRVVESAAVVFLRRRRAKSDLLHLSRFGASESARRIFDGLDAVDLASGGARWEVLLGQNEVINFVRSEPERRVLQRYPGELKFAGGNLDPGESFEQAARRELEEEFLGPADLSLPGSAVLRPLCVKQTLPIRSKSNILANFVALEAENPWLRALDDVRPANARLQQRKAQFLAMVAEGRVPATEAAREAVAPEVRRLTWVPLSEAIFLMLSTMSESAAEVFVDGWQRDELRRLGVRRRDPMFMSACVLLDVAAYADEAALQRHAPVGEGALVAERARVQWLFDGMTDADVLLEGSRAKGEPAEMIKSMPEVLRLRAERGAAALEESRL